MAKRMPKDGMKTVFEALHKDYRLAAPVRVDGVLTFKEVKGPLEVELSDELPYQSPKEFLFPHVEKMMCFICGGDVVDCVKAEPTVIFGIRPCDLEAARVMTAVFTTGRYADAYFSQRLEQTVLIGLGCLNMKKGCFCDERGLDKSYSANCDVFLTDLGDSYCAEAISEKGKALLEKLSLAEMPAIDHKPFESDKPLLELHAEECDLFDKIDWDEITEKCQGCGMCTFICPTCHCFEFRDVEEKGETNRYKCWDSCMYAKFTMHASGHNPRATKKERFRQRVAHKYQYVKKNFGAVACTGCGRCIRSCPAGMNIKTVVKQINAALDGACAPKQQ